MPEHVSINGVWITKDQHEKNQKVVLEAATKIAVTVVPKPVVKPKEVTKPAPKVVKAVTKPKKRKKKNA